MRIRTREGGGFPPKQRKVSFAGDKTVAKLHAWNLPEDSVMKVNEEDVAFNSGASLCPVHVSYGQWCWKQSAVCITSWLQWTSAVGGSPAGRRTRGASRGRVCTRVVSESKMMQTREAFLFCLSLLDGLQKYDCVGMKSWVYNRSPTAAEQKNIKMKKINKKINVEFRTRRSADGLSAWKEL